MFLRYIDSERWSKILILLSMDMVVPFYHVMGFNLPNTQEFVEILRDLIVINYKKQIENPNEISLFVTESIRKIADKFGEDFCRQLLQWGRFIFTENLQDHPELYQWKMVLEFGHSTVWENLGWPATLSIESQQKFAEFTNTDKYFKIHQQTYAQPFSDWDLCLYAIRQFDDENFTAVNRPDKWVYHTLLTEQHRNFWAWVLTQLTPTEQTLLQKKATEVVRIHHLTIQGELQHPRFLGRNYEQ